MSQQNEPLAVSRRLGNLLVTHGSITQQQLGMALDEQKRTGAKLSAILVRLGFTTEEELVHFLSRQYRVRSVTLPQSGIDSEALRLIPAGIARKYDVIPVQHTSRSLTLAMADPTDLAAVDDVAFLTGLHVIPCIAPLTAIRRAIDQSYGALPSVDLVTEASEVEVVEDQEATAPIEMPSADIAPLIRLVNNMLLDAIRREASDIHLEHWETGLGVRFRIDGVLHVVMTAPKRLEAAIISRIKIMANLDIAERRLPQDGGIKLRVQPREVDLRVSVLPTVFGEGVAIRILDREVLKRDLAALGFDARDLEQFQKAIRSTYGMILITGPTGSGKTTTLYAAIQTLNSRDINIMTVEDPVEYNLAGINQVQVNEEIGRTFAAVLRSFLRHDPDLILVGEMRDLETAQIAVRAALTGHLVFTTVHTNDCPSTIVRLVDMGIPPFLIAASLRMVVAQRLVRKLCPDCKETYEADEESLLPYGHRPLGLGRCILYQAKGCPTCNFTGMRGRVAIYEVMPVSEEIRNLIVQNAPTSQVREVARTHGTKTLREGGLLKVIEGITTVEEVLRVTPE